MKVKFKRQVTIDIIDIELNQREEDTFYPGDEIAVEGIDGNDKRANLCLTDGTVALDVPNDSFQIVP